MADFKDFLRTDGYLARLTRLNEVKTALAQWLSVGTHSNVPEGAIRWSQSQKRWEVYSGGTWGALETEYNVNVKQLQGAEPNTAASNSTLVKRTATGQVKAAAPSTNDEVTTRAFSDARYVRQENLGDSGGVSVENAAKLGGQLPAYYRNASNINAGTLPLARGGTGATSAGAARTSLGFTLSAPMLARLNAGKDHSLQVWQDGTATEGGLISPAQLAEAAGDKTAIGTVNWFALSTPPDGWLVCDGRAITNLYPDLRQALIDDGFPWGQDGSGNPLLPNPVDGNRFPRAAGGDLPVGTVQEDAIRNITGKATNVSSWGFAGSENLDGAFYASRTFTDGKVAGQSSQPMIDFAFDASRVVPTADENRPKAVAMLLCIKAFGSVVNIPGQADMDYIIEQTKSYTDDTVSNLPLGYEWIDVIDDRAHDTWYENTTPWPIFVSIYSRSNTTTRRYLEIREGDGDPIKVGSFSASTTPGNNVCVVTHPGWSYRVDGRIGQADPFLWVECRRVS